MLVPSAIYASWIESRGHGNDDGAARVFGWLRVDPAPFAAGRRAREHGAPSRSYHRGASRCTRAGGAVGPARSERPVGHPKPLISCSRNGPMRMTRNRKFAAISLFSGCGGFDLAVEMTNMGRVVWANDNFPAA